MKYQVLLLFYTSTAVVIFFNYFIPNRKRHLKCIIVQNVTQDISCDDNYDAPIINQAENQQLKNHPIEFLPNVANPCWYERFDDDDINELRNNMYVPIRKNYNVKNLLMNLSITLQRRLESESKTKNIRLRCLPHFIIIGEIKSGTTDLYDRLALHPRIQMPVLKEPFWFSHEAKVPFSQYLDLHGLSAIKLEAEINEKRCRNPNKEISIIGEGSVAMFDDRLWGDKGEVYKVKQNEMTSTPAFLKWVLPDIKLILILRNPITRLFSHYLYFNPMPLSQNDFHERVVNLIDKFENCTKGSDVDHCVNDPTFTDNPLRLDRGLYSVFLKEWLKHFQRKNILVLHFEEYSTNILNELKKVYTFLNLDYPSKETMDVILTKFAANKGSKDIGPMWNSTWDILQEFYHPYNQELVKLLNDSRFLW